MMRGGILALAAALQLAALLAMPAPVAAATAQCVPAARFSTLARITDGNMGQLADLMGVPGKVPPGDGCRSILLSGSLTKGSAAALLSEISRNKGWLATVFIAVSDGDLKEEIEIARLMRDFRLAGEVVAGPGLYVPDFLVVPRTMPASVSNSWPDPGATADAPLLASFKDYLENTERKVTRGRSPCGAACWTILAGAVERRVLGVARSRQADGVAQPPEDERVRDAARRELGPKVVLVKQAAGYLPIPKMAPYAADDRKDIEAECKPVIDFAGVLAAEIAETSDKFAKRRYPFMKLLPLQQKVRRFVEAGGNAEVCVRKALTRLRMAAFTKYCAPTCEDRLATTEAEAAKALARYAGPAAAGGGVVAEPQSKAAPAAVVTPAPNGAAVPDADADDEAAAPPPEATPVLRRPQRPR